MFLWSLGHDHHIVNVHLQLLMDHVMKQGGSHSLIRCSSIFQTEWHDFVAESAELRNEGGLCFISQCHFNLIVPRKTVHDGVATHTSCIIYQYIDVRERKIILWRS